nr:MAG TPA: hypothetical protein [Caudoviricetes sp.]
MYLLHYHIPPPGSLALGASHARTLEEDVA